MVDRRLLSGDPAGQESYQSELLGPKRPLLCVGRSGHQVSFLRPSLRLLGCPGVERSMKVGGTQARRKKPIYKHEDWRWLDEDDCYFNARASLLIERWRQD